MGAVRVRSVGHQIEVGRNIRHGAESGFPPFASAVHIPRAAARQQPFRPVGEEKEKRKDDMEGRCLHERGAK